MGGMGVLLSTSAERLDTMARSLAGLPWSFTVAHPPELRDRDDEDDRWRDEEPESSPSSSLDPNSASLAPSSMPLVLPPAPLSIRLVGKRLLPLRLDPS